MHKIFIASIIASISLLSFTGCDLFNKNKDVPVEGTEIMEEDFVNSEDFLEPEKDPFAEDLDMGEDPFAEEVVDDAGEAEITEEQIPEDEILETMEPVEEDQEFELEYPMVTQEETEEPTKPVKKKITVGDIKIPSELN